jgi:flagellar motor component MotA
LALEEGLEHLANDFFKQGIRMVVDGTDAEYIRDILQIKLERENDFYRKKLMETAMAGILSIQAGDSPRVLALLLASLVNIENNPLEAACAKYLSGDSNALIGIDFFAAMQPEGEREEIGFIKHALEFSETARREGFLAMEEHLDHEKIAARDVFEYGIVFIIDGWDAVDIARILDNLIAHETDPVRKNISLAKKEAVLSINAGVNPRLLLAKLCAFFGESIETELMNLYD